VTAHKVSEGGVTLDNGGNGPIKGGRLRPNNLQVDGSGGGFVAIALKRGCEFRALKFQYPRLRGDKASTGHRRIAKICGDSHAGKTPNCCNKKWPNHTPPEHPEVLVLSSINGQDHSQRSFYLGCGGAIPVLRNSHSAHRFLPLRYSRLLRGLPSGVWHMTDCSGRTPRAIGSGRESVRQGKKCR